MLASPRFRAYVVGELQKRIAPPADPVNVTAEKVRMPEAYHAMKQRLVAECSVGGGKMELPYSDDVVPIGAKVDIDHIVPIHWALTAGAAGWSKTQWRQFQSDPANLMLALPNVNRHDKGDRGPGHWVPAHHRPWYCFDFSMIVIAYRLSVSRPDFNVIESTLRFAD